MLFPANYYDAVYSVSVFMATSESDNGFLTDDDVNGLLPLDVISSGQINQIINTNKWEERGERKREDILGLLPAIGKTGDPVKMYLRDMGLVSMLSREGEVEIAKMIEEGAQESMEAVFSVRISLKDVVNIGVQLKSGEIHVKSVVAHLDDEDGNVKEDMYREQVPGFTTMPVSGRINS
jgi:RNA polymerase primary sigma factor